MGGPILVTGAAGFAGGHLLDLLAADGPPIFAWHRPGGQPPRAVGQVRWEAVDLLNRQAVRDAIRSARPSVVYHLAGAAHVGQSWGSATHTLEVNVLGTHHVLEALRAEAPGARVLVASSALVYAPRAGALDEDCPLAPESPYGISKLAQELVGTGHAGALGVYLARPFNHIGPRQSPSFSSAAFARQIAEIEAGVRPPEISVGNMDAQRDLTDVRDVVRAYRSIVESGRPERAYNVCSGRAVAVQSVLDLLVSHSRVAVRVVTDPSKFRPNDTPVVLGNPARIRSELGWTTEIPLERTTSDLLEYWRGEVRRGG
ncbi:MAG: GDP-mannose 4,6-dehydratase [Vicinamibacterales bacterium]